MDVVEELMSLILEQSRNDRGKHSGAAGSNDQYG
jgi:hypothetical protein